MSQLERTGAELDVRPPDAVVAPAGVPHGIRSTEDVPVRQVARVNAR